MFQMVNLKKIIPVVLTYVFSVYFFFAALFDAIEMQDYDTCFTILTENDLDINA